MKERRRSVRERTSLRGGIYLANGKYLPCAIRDISYEGARINLDSPVEIFGDITLCIPTKKQIVYGSVRWRHGSRAGIVFSKIIRQR